MRASLLILLIPACKVVDAPEDLEDLVGFGFVHFDDAVARAAVVENLVPALQRRREALREGMRVDRLQASDLVEAGVERPGPVDILGAVGLVGYTHDPAEVVGVITHPRRDQVFEGTTDFVVHERGDRACFLAERCDEYFQEHTETAQVPILGRSVTHATLELAWVETRDGELAVLGRTLAPEPVVFDTKLIAVHQQYGFYALLPTGGATERVEAFWVDADFLGLDVPDRFAVNSAVTAMQGYADEIDAFLDR